MESSEPTSGVRSNKWPFLGIVLAVIGFFILGTVNTESALELISVPAGLLGIACVVLCIMGLKRARSAHKGKVLSIVGIVIGLFVGLSVLRPVLDSARRSANAGFKARIIGKPVPAFALTTTGGARVSNVGLTGTPYVLAFQPSAESFSKLDTLRQFCGSRSVKVFAVVPADVADRVEGFAKANRFGVPIARDPNSEAFSALLLSAGPASVLVGADGLVAQVVDGVDYQGAVKQAIISAPSMHSVAGPSTRGRDLQAGHY